MGCAHKAHRTRSRSLLPGCASLLKCVARVHNAPCPGGCSLDKVYLSIHTHPPSKKTQRGCVNCVWDEYATQLRAYEHTLAQKEGRAAPEDPFATLEQRLVTGKKNPPT